ncbi:hypothetical protein LINPERPRIM_LOCUS20887 [Linum perenne]
MFLLTIGPSAKNRTCQVLFHRSAETMSHTIKKVLLSIVNHQALLISQPVPVPESCDNHKLKYFKVSTIICSACSHVTPPLFCDIFQFF